MVYMGFWGLNSGPHTWKVSTLVTKLSTSHPIPNPHTFTRLLIFWFLITHSAIRVLQFLRAPSNHLGSYHHILPLPPLLPHCHMPPPYFGVSLIMCLRPKFHEGQVLVLSLTQGLSSNILLTCYNQLNDERHQRCIVCSSRVSSLVIMWEDRSMDPLEFV